MCQRVLLLLTLPILFSINSAVAVDLLDKGTLIQTGANNSLEKESLFRYRRKNGKNMLITKSELVNIHAHSTKSSVKQLKSYRYTGQFRITEENGGVGVTFHSDYPNSDTYYRLRRYEGNAFHIAPHGTSITSGETDTGVTPRRKRWYKFKVQVRTRSDETVIKAKVWRANAREPRAWQVDCSDSSDTRISSGRPGVWSMADGKKMWRDLAVKKGG